MILCGQRRTEKGHDAVTGELIDGAFPLMNLTHQYFETSVHNLVHFFRIKPL